MKKLLLLALLTAMLFSCDNGDIVTISGGSLPEPLDMAFTDKMMSVGTWGMCLPSAVESYLKNKGGLSTGEIDKLRGILSIED